MLRKALLSFISALCLTLLAYADAQGPNAAVQSVLDKYRALRPADSALMTFQLDWVPTLKEAREKAVKEQRPILLIVVTNSYGNMFTGHC